MIFPYLCYKLTCAIDSCHFYVQAISFSFDKKWLGKFSRYFSSIKIIYCNHGQDIHILFIYWHRLPSRQVASETELDYYHQRIYDLPLDLGL